MIEIRRLIRRLEKELADAEWNGLSRIAADLRAKLDILYFKRNIGDTHDQEW